MKKQIALIGMSALLFGSCVTLGKYEALESKNTQLRREFNATQGELNDLREENAELQRQNQSLNAEIVELTDNNNKNIDAIKSLKQEMANMKMGYDTVIENYMQRITGQSQNLDRANNLLAARTKELSDKEEAFKAKEETFRTRENELRAKQEELEKQEASTRKALEAKEKELEHLRSSLNNALVGFADKGLNVETRDGKVYVSMESKLLFPSASWTVSKDGVEAIKTLAKVLEDNTDLNILVEGHTDNAAYKGSNGVKDNWDLSVMRATSIVKLLLQYGPKIDPSRIEACGHGEFAPKVPNDTPANKALNRRTEIILTPKMSDILNLIEN
ncbi:MAG: OmpA family protein [Bacteroidales bacterium]|nr:OmpA family protein [Bacteroidales bacterium]